MENVFGTTPEIMDASDEEEQSAEDAAAETTDTNMDVAPLTAGRTKTFTYTIEETGGNVAGVTNDTSKKTITVTVTDEGEGKISVKATSDQNAQAGNDFTFTNVYNVDPKESSLTGDGGFALKKELQANTDRVLDEGEFTFQLIDPADGSVAAEAKNAADGIISMPAQNFTKPGDYSYILKEVKEDAAGIEYDSKAYTVIAHVTDQDADGNYTGQLAVTWEIPQAAEKTVTFTNVYTADPTSVTLGAGKLIKGRNLTAGEFSFQLTDENGNEVDTAKNEENGAVTFKTITFEKPGSYSYNICEVLPKDEDSGTDGIQSNNVTYDETIYHVTVDVKDNMQTGCLEATVTYVDSDGAPLFVNNYTEPKKEIPADDGEGTLLGVKTGDIVQILPILIIMAAAFIVIIAMSVILIRRRKK